MVVPCVWMLKVLLNSKVFTVRVILMRSQRVSVRTVEVDWSRDNVEKHQYPRCVECLYKVMKRLV